MAVFNETLYFGRVKAEDDWNGSDVLLALVHNGKGKNCLLNYVNFKELCEKENLFFKPNKIKEGGGSLSKSDEEYYQAKLSREAVGTPVVLEGLLSVSDMAEYMVKNGYLRSREAVEVVNKIVSKRDMLGKSVSNDHVPPLQKQPSVSKEVSSQEHKAKKEQEVESNNSVVEEPVKSIMGDDKSKVVTEVGVREEIVITQNSTSEEKVLVQAEIEVVVKELKEKKKGANDKAIALLGKTKVLLDRFSQEQVKESNIKRVNVMKADDLKLREDVISKENEHDKLKEVLKDVIKENFEISKEKEHDKLKEVLKDVFKENFEIVIQKVESTSVAVVGQIVDSTEDVITVCNRLEPKVDTTKEYVESLEGVLK